MAGAKQAPEAEQATTTIGEVNVDVVPEIVFKQEPGVGRIVRYVTGSGGVRPAIIAGVKDDALELVVFNRADGALFVEDVVEDPTGDTIGTYHWPVID